MSRKIWKPLIVPNKPELNGRYLISNKGELRFVDGRKKKQYKNTNGYMITGISYKNKTKQYRVHRLILYTFKPNTAHVELDVNHINNKRHDNRLENLEWCTRKENMQHAKKQGRIKVCRGELSGKAKLTWQKVTWAREMYESEPNVSIASLARFFDVAYMTMNNVINNRTWKVYN